MAECCGTVNVRTAAIWRAMRHNKKCRTRTSGHPIRTDSANRRSAPGQEQVMRRCSEPDFRNCRQIGGERKRRNDQVDRGSRSLDAVAEKRDRARVICVVGVGVNGGVKLWTNREQPQHPDQQCAKSCDPAKGWRRFRFGAEEQHVPERTHHSRHVKRRRSHRDFVGSTKSSFLVAISPEKRPFRFSKKSQQCGLLTAHFSQLVTVARDDKKGSRAFDWPVVRTRA